MIERAYRVGQINTARSSAPRPIVIKFSNYKDRETTLQTAREQREVRYDNDQVSFFPDLSPGTRQRQLLFDAVKARLHTLNSRYGLLYPAHLVITHEDKRQGFTTVREVEEFLATYNPLTPTNPSFFQNLFLSISSDPGQHIIGGDFNCVFYLVQDRSTGVDTSHQQTRKII